MHAQTAVCSISPIRHKTQMHTDAQAIAPHVRACAILQSLNNLKVFFSIYSDSEEEKDREEVRRKETRFALCPQYTKCNKNSNHNKENENVSQYLYLNGDKPGCVWLVYYTQCTMQFSRLKDSWFQKKYIRLLCFPAKLPVQGHSLGV